MQYVYANNLMQWLLTSQCGYWLVKASVAIAMGTFNTLRPRPNDRRFADDTLKRIFLNENVWIPIEISLSLSLRVQLTIFQHWFRKWLGAVQATSHYLNQWSLVYRRIYASLGLLIPFAVQWTQRDTHIIKLNGMETLSALQAVIHRWIPLTKGQ